MVCAHRLIDGISCTHLSRNDRRQGSHPSTTSPVLHQTPCKPRTDSTLQHVPLALIKDLQELHSLFQYVGRGRNSLSAVEQNICIWLGLGV